MRFIDNLGKPFDFYTAAKQAVEAENAVRQTKIDNTSPTNTVQDNTFVSVEKENGTLYFYSLIKASGNSVIRIVFFDKKYFKDH